jgi:hypothetical protein
VSAAPTSLPPAEGDGDNARQHAFSYEQFLRAVVVRQLENWLPRTSSRVLDISRADPIRGVSPVSDTIARAGHHVIRVDNPTCPDRSARAVDPTDAGSRRFTRVVGDTRYLDWFRSQSVDAVVAEGSALSSCLATETTVEQAFRMLKPGGQLLLSVDSLLHGLARLAEQRRWPELADASAGDVVLVPAEGSGYTRAFGAEELRSLVSAAGFTVEWIRPRTVIPPDVVGHALADDPGMLDDLVTSELNLAVERQGESVGRYLLLSAARLG